MYRKKINSFDIYMVSTWSLYLRESCDLHIRRRDLGGDAIFDGPVLKQALDHITHWRRPGFVFLSSKLPHSDQNIRSV